LKAICCNTKTFMQICIVGFKENIFILLKVIGLKHYNMGRKDDYYIFIQLMNIVPSTSTSL